MTHATQPPPAASPPDFCQLLRTLFDSQQQGFASLREVETGEVKVGESAVYEAKSILPGGLHAQVTLVPIEGKKGEYLRIYEDRLGEDLSYTAASELYMKLISQLTVCLSDVLTKKPQITGDGFTQLWLVSVPQGDDEEPISLELIFEADQDYDTNRIFIQVF